MAVLQDEFEFAVRDGLKLKDAVNIDDGRSMNTDEAHGIETIGELIEGRAVKQLLAGEVQIGIRAVQISEKGRLLEQLVS